MTGGSTQNEEMETRRNRQRRTNSGIGGYIFLFLKEELTNLNASVKGFLILALASNKEVYLVKGN